MTDIITDNSALKETNQTTKLIESVFLPPTIETSDTKVKIDTEYTVVQNLNLTINKFKTLTGIIQVKTTITDIIFHETFHQTSKNLSVICQEAKV